MSNVYSFDVTATLRSTLLMKGTNDKEASHSWSREVFWHDLCQGYMIFFCGGRGGLMRFFLLSHDVFHYTTARFTVGRMEGDNFGHSLVLFY